MTPGNTDLLCRCGKHSARFHEGKAKKGKKVKHWMIFVVGDGKKPRPKSTRTEKQKAWEVVNKLCQGDYEAPNQKMAPPPAADRELRDSSRLLVDYNDQLQRYELAHKYVDSTSAVSIALIRQALYRESSQPHPMSAHRQESLNMFYTSMGDGKEGVAAFQGKRPAVLAAKVSTHMPPTFPWWQEPSL